MLAFNSGPALATKEAAAGERGLNEPLRPLAEYRAALDRAMQELDAIVTDLGGDNSSVSTTSLDDALFLASSEDFSEELFASAPPAVPLTAQQRSVFKARLHAGELGFFWVTSRGTDRYMMGQRSPFARDKEDLWKLLPEKSGPLGKFLQPDFDNPDDKLCLVYSCVNDPRAPPSIDVLYSLKLLDEGLATEGVTAGGLLNNAVDSRSKLTAYLALVDAEADPALTDDDWRNPAPAKGWGKVGV